MKLDDVVDVRRDLVEQQEDAFLLLLEAHLRLVLIADRPLDLFSLDREEEALVLQVKDVDKEAVLLLGGDAPVVRADKPAPCAIDRLAILAHPFAHLFQALEGGLRQAPVGLRADVHEQVRVHAGRLHQVMDQLLGRLVILVGDLIAPHAVHGLAGLQRQVEADLLAFREAGRVLSGQVALEDLDVLAGDGRLVVVVADQAAGLRLMDAAIDAGEAPVEIRIVALVPFPVEPDGVHFAVVGEQLVQLVVHKGVIVFPLAFQRASRAAAAVAQGHVVVAGPVDERVIEMEVDALLMARVGQLLDDIPFERGRLGDGEVAVLAVEHREAVVVAGREADVFSARGLDGLDPLAGVERGGIETTGHLAILLVVDVLVIEDPFAIRQHTVDAPMDKDSELVVLEFFPGLQDLW